MYGYIPFSLSDSPQHTQYCCRKLSRCIRRMYFSTDQAKESVVSVILAQCLQFIYEPVKQESTVGFTSCSLADSHFSFIAKLWWLWEYFVASCSHLPFTSSMALNISGKDAELFAHPRSLWAHLWLDPWSLEGLGPPVLHRALPHCSSQTLRRCLTHLMSFYVTHSRRTDIKCESLCPSFSSWSEYFISYTVALFLCITNYIS